LFYLFAEILSQKLMRNLSSTEFPEPAETGNRPRAPAVAPTVPTPPLVSPPPLGVGGTSPIIVRAEEALIVLLVLVLWIAAIALFFNRWGKIRMLEPYQPKFQQQHRSSCPMVDMNGPIGLQVIVTCCFNSRLCDDNRMQITGSYKAEPRAMTSELPKGRFKQSGGWLLVRNCHVVFDL